MFPEHGDADVVAERDRQLHGFEPLRFRHARVRAGALAFPVVEPGALHLFFVEREPERLDQMQRRANRETRAAGIAGVPVDLGMDEDDVERHGCGTGLTCPERWTVAER